MSDTIGSRIKRKRLEEGMTLEEVGKIADVSRATMQRYESGNITNIPSDRIERIAQALHIAPSYIMGWEEKNDDSPYRQVPLIGRVAAETPILADENIEDYFAIDRSIQADYCLRVQGDSMIDAGIHDGHVAFIKKVDMVDNGEIAVIVIDEEATLKTIFIEDEAVILQPANNKYRPKIITDGQVRIAGKLAAILNMRH